MELERSGGWPLPRTTLGLFIFRPGTGETPNPQRSRWPSNFLGVTWQMLMILQSVWKVTLMVILQKYWFLSSLQQLTFTQHYHISGPADNTLHISCSFNAHYTSRWKVVLLFHLTFLLSGACSNWKKESMFLGQIKQDKDMQRASSVAPILAILSLPLHPCPIPTLLAQPKPTDSCIQSVLRPTHASTYQNYLGNYPPHFVDKENTAQGG